MLTSVKTVGTTPQPTISYNLDGVQNRTSVTNGPDAGTTYTLSPTTQEPNDIAVNQYTSIPHGGGTNNTFDTNGTRDDKLVSYAARTALKRLQNKTQP